MVLKMDGGAAGFFNDKELSEGKGVIELLMGAEPDEPVRPPVDRRLEARLEQPSNGRVHAVRGHHHRRGRLAVDRGGRRLESDPASVGHWVDWVAKQRLVDGFRARHDLPADSPRCPDEEALSY